MNIEEMISITGKREASFRVMVNFLRGIKSPKIVETGCARVENNFEGDGMSTLIFDAFVRENGGSLASVDISEDSVDFAKSKITSDRTTIFCEDSVGFLHRHSVPIDLLYLDSYDLDQDNTHPSSLHHIHELLAVSKCLKKGTMVVVDDNLNDEIGKGKYIAEYFSKIGVPMIYTGYQQIWKI